MSVRDEMFGVLGGWRENVSPNRIDEAREQVIEAARRLAWDIHRRSTDEILTDNEVGLLNKVSLMECYKTNPWWPMYDKAITQKMDGEQS